MAEKRITVDGTDPVLLFGLNDRNLRKLESSFPDINIVARGHEIVLRGETDDLEKVQDVLTEMQVVINQHGELTKDDLETILALHASGDGPATSKSNEVVLFTPSGGIIKPRTPNQARLVASAHRNDIVFAIGPAGTGKTYIGMALAVAALRSGQVKRIVLTRPAVEAGEQLGFLPGDFREKIDPYLRPLYDALEDMMPREKLAMHLEQGIIEIVPLAYMRGRTMKSAFVLLDEAQNATRQQMKMFLTRLGPDSRTIVTGDITQTDLPSRTHSGLVEVQRILTDVDGIDFVYFNRDDVVRHRLVKEIIDAYDEHDAG